MNAESEIVSSWPEKFLTGDHSDDDCVVGVLKSQSKVDGIPLLFDVGPKLAPFRFLEENDVSLVQREDSGETILQCAFAEQFNLDTYRFLAEHFARQKAIDWAEKEGVTPLSAMIKVGALSHARILLESGASIQTFATIARYGGSRLDIPTQAVNCLPGDCDDPGTASIEALKLLQDFGYQPDRQEARNLKARTREARPGVASWIEANLIGKDSIKQTQ